MSRLQWRVGVEGGLGGGGGVEWRIRLCGSEFAVVFLFFFIILTVEIQMDNNSDVLTLPLSSANLRLLMKPGERTTLVQDYRPRPHHQTLVNNW